MKPPIHLILVISAAFVTSMSAQLTPVNDIGTHTVSVGVPEKFAAAFPTEASFTYILKT